MSDPETLPQVIEGHGALERMDLGVNREPQVVLQEAQRAAQALKGIIDAKPQDKKVIMNGETYLEFEDWQTVGRFYAISPQVRTTNYVQFGDARGWEALADAIHVPTGRVVASAEAMCLNDEDKWRSRPKYEWHYVKKSGGTSAEDPGKDELIWEAQGGKNRPKKQRVHTGDEAVPLFQLRSMAQTRACAKALRNALAWVVVLAGYKATPAEELTGTEGGGRQMPVPQTESQPPPPQQPPPGQEQGSNGKGEEIISDAQRKRLWAIVNEHGWSADAAKELIGAYGYASSNDIKKKHYEEIVNKFKEGRKAPQAP